MSANAISNCPKWIHQLLQNQGAWKEPSVSVAKVNTLVEFRKSILILLNTKKNEMNLNSFANSFFFTEL